MIKNTNYFFYLLPKMYGWVGYGGSRVADLPTQGPKYESLENLFSLPGYVTSRTPA